MNLIIDIGNTRAKLALFNGGDLYLSETVMYEELMDRIAEISGKFDIDRSIVSNVGRSFEGLDGYLGSRYFHINLDHNTLLPIEVDYETPHTLGVDRRALAVAASTDNSANSSLVIDMGSCITYDFVTSDRVYRGGAISPGMNMRFRAMNNFTESLPLVSFRESDSALGKNTEMSMVNGVVMGISAEIDAYIDRLKSEYGNISVIITGGDYPFFVNKLKNSIFADQKILLRGLNIILNYNFDLRNENII